MISMYSGKTRKLFLLTALAAGIGLLPVMAQTEKAARAGSTRGRPVEAKPQEDFLPDAEENRDFLPELFRCSECGYEQDEEGSCPDHTEIELIKVLSRGRDPLEPPELDGNEDIIVDIPMRGMQFRKAPLATDTEELP